MKNIKYKYWNSSEKKMFYQPDRGWAEFPHTLEKDDEYLQFTGLLDKTGKEIYEGDIVKVSKKEITYIEFEKGAFWFCFNNENRLTYDWMRQQDFSHDPQKDFEIIGNIYENPNLLPK